MGTLAQAATDSGMRARLPGVGDVMDGRYRLTRDLGRGAAGAVYEARHLFTGRSVALKLLLPQERRDEHDEMKERMKREAQLLASIRHPGVVEVLDGGFTSGVPFLVLEMLEGRTLAGILAARRTLSVADAVAVALQLCDALGAVHRAGVLHRDIKPATIFVVRGATGGEIVKLVDFGIARMEDAELDPRLTAAGTVLGSPAYMAPERMLGRGDDDVRTDVFSLGATLYECLAGKPPLCGSYQEIVVEIAGPAPMPSLQSVAPEVPEALARVVDRAVAKSPAARFASAGDMAFALEHALPDPPRSSALLGPATRGTQGSAPVQRRRAPRAPYATPVRMRLESGVLDDRSEDISEGGLLVLAETPCAQGQRIALRFALPMEGKVVSVEAFVRWVRAATGRVLSAMGLEFVDLPATVRASVLHYVELMGERRLPGA